MEQYIAYILSIAGNVDTLAPCYGIVPSDDLTEWIAPDLKGFEGHGPVRIGNAAVDQVQHDAYGSVILAAMPMFFDKRLPQPRRRKPVPADGEDGAPMRGAGAGARCRHLGISRPKAHPYPFRRHVLGRPVAHRRHCRAPGPFRPRRTIGKAWPTNRRGDAGSVWNEKRKAFAAAEDTDDMDASVLLLPELGLIEPHDPRFASTVAAIEQDLVRGRHVMRYAAEDDFGLPETEFLVCRFWLIDALWRWAGARKRASAIRMRWPCATVMACSRKTSIPRPARCGAISPRPIPWPG